MPTDNEIIVQLTAETAQLQAGMDAGAAAVTKATEEMQATIVQEAAAFNAAVQSKIDAQVRLNAAFAGGITSTAGIAEAEAALDQAMAAGAITAAEYASYVGRLDTSEIDLAASTVAATTATEANTVAMTINGGVARELGVLIGELARGNYTRMEGSTITLANRTGVLSSVLSALMSPLGLLTIGAGAAGVAVFEAALDFDKMQGAVLATGDASGYTAGQLMEMANTIGEQSGSISAAREAVMGLAESGKFAGEDLRYAAQAAVDMAALTGESVKQTASTIEKLRENPLRAVVALNDQFHFLTVAQYENMQQMVKTGGQIDAARLGMEAFANAMHDRTQTMEADANVLVKAWHAVKNEYSTTMQEANVALGGGDIGERLAVAKERMAELTTEAARYKSSLPTYGLGMLAAHNASVEAAVVKKLQAEVDAQTAKVKAAAAEAQATANTIDGMSKKHGAGSTGHANHEQAQADRDAFNEQRLQHSMSLAEEKTYWQGKLAAAKEGTDAYRQAVNELLQIKNKEASESKTEARQEITDAKHVAAEKVRAAKEAEREAEAAARKARELSLEQIKAAHDEATGSIANKRQQYQLEYSEGQISAARLLQLEQQLAAEKLAIDKQYYQDKAKLDAADQVAVTKDEAAIVKAQQDALASMLRYEREFHNNSVKQWQSYAKQVEGAMQGAINGMLFQHQTLRQGIANISLVIGEDFIKEAVMKPVDAWISGEATKTAAALAGATQRQVIESGAAAVSKAADAATGRSQITSAAATGAAKAYQAVVGIPIVGPILAPIAAGVAFAGIEEFGGKLSSARGGWSRVPYDGAMTELHVDEKVLPAKEARGLDRLINGGGQGGGNTFNIHANDAKSFKEMMRRDPAAFAAVAKLAHRRGHFGGMR